MNKKLAKLIEERTRLAADLRKSPTGVNFEGKPFPPATTPYLKELDRKIAGLRTGRIQGRRQNRANFQKGA